MKAQTETKWVCIQLACSWRPRAFEEAHCWNIQAKFYNEKFPPVYESDKQETLYHEDYGATLKHKCGKKDSNIVPSLFFSHFFGPSSFFMAFLSFFIFLFFLTWDNALENDDHHTSIYLQLNDYNSILKQSMTLYECLRWYTG